MSRPLSVFLDNGHGNNTPGKRSSFPGLKTLYEYEVNRDIVNMITLLLEKAGVPCTRVVPELHDVSISERIMRVNRMVSAASNDGFQSVLVSVHANAGKGSGFEAWTSKGKTRSDRLAEMILDAAPKYLKGFAIRKDVTDGDGDKESDAFSILTKTLCPAVLTENLFMDTLKDYHFISSHAGRVALAEMHVHAILNYKELL